MAANGCVFQSLPGLYGCTAKQAKNFDSYLYADAEVGGKHPIIVGEVAFRHGNFAVLLEEGLSAVSRYTDAGWVVLFHLKESTRSNEALKVNDIRVVALERRASFASDSDLRDKASKSNCRKPLLSTTKQLASINITDAKVIYDREISREEITAPELCVIQLDSALIAKYLRSMEWFPAGPVRLDFERMLTRIIRTTDLLVSKQTYPYF